MLAKIALAKHDTDAAREEAALARAEDPTLPLPIYIDARLLYDQGKYADALPGFLEAIAELKKSGTLQINELHFYTGGHAGAARTRTRRRKRSSSRSSSTSRRTSAPAAGWRCSTRRAASREAATRVLDDMLRITPTPDSYALAARLYTMFGNRKQAEAVKLEARRAFANTPRSSAKRAPK